MFESTYCLLSILGSVERVKGRKKLQKTLHLLESSGADVPFKYEYHFFGPYSAELQEEVNFSVQQGFIEETKIDETYVYTITEKGRKFKERLDASGDYQFNLDDELLNSLSHESSQFLEMVSTYAFLIESGYKPEEAKIKAVELKEHLKNCINEAVEFYKVKIAGKN